MFFRIFLLTLGLLVPVHVSAKPVPDDAPKAETVFRRIALVVSDIELSLRFYRDGLGQVVTDDRTKLSPDGAKTVDEATGALCMILMRSTDDYVGELELIQFIKPARTPLPRLGDKERSPGSLVIMFATPDMNATMAKLQAIPGTHVVEPPHSYTYPAYSGVGTTTDLIAIVRDPDGYVVELIQPSAGIPTDK